MPGICEKQLFPYVYTTDEIISKCFIAEANNYRSIITHVLSRAVHI